jgi:hypothetical protein
MQPIMENGMAFVLGKSPKSAGNPPKEGSVTALSEFQDKVWQVLPPRRHDNRKSYFQFVAEQLEWKPRRVRAFFHGEARTIRAEELVAITRRLDALKEAEARHREEIHEIQAHRTARESSAEACGNSIELGGQSEGEGLARPVRATAVKDDSRGAAP